MTEQKLEIGTDKIEIEVEHDLGIVTLGLLCLVIWAPCWWYDTEIRCALGSEKSCITLKAEPAKKAQ